MSSKVVVGSALVISMLAGLPARAHPEDDHESCGSARRLGALFAQGLNPDGSGGEFGPREAMSDTDVLDNFLDIEVFPSAASGDNIVGSNTMTIRSTVNNLTQFTFMLRSNFNISSILLNGVTPLTATSVGTYGRRVTFPSPMSAGQQFTLKISYNGRAVSRGFGSIEFVTLGGNPAVFSLSEPYYAATWWPAKDGDVQTAGDNRDKATFSIHVTHPSTLTCASNGLLQGIDALSGGRSKTRWRTNYPMASYLACIGVAQYNTFSGSYSYPLPNGGNGVMPMQFFVSPASDNPTLRNVWLSSSAMMAAFRPVFGEYPFVNEKYGIYQFTFGGGMEHQTMTGQSSSTSESLTAHELGHQWWGDNVTCQTWSDIWLNEGFATYSECIWAERKPGSTGTPALLAAIAARRPGSTSGSVYRYDVSSASSIFDSTNAYNKGAWVVHMLRHRLGDANFFAGIQAYRAAYQGSAATTDDCRNILETVHGADLDAFFTSWVYGTGAPAFAYGTQLATINGRDYLKLRVRQTQTQAPFPSTLDVRTVRAVGTTNSRIDSTAATQWFVVPVSGSGAVSSVTLDPDGWNLNNGKVSEAFAAGPPAVVETSTLPGQSYAAGAGPANLRVTFSENPSPVPVAANFTLTREGSPVAFSVAYSAGTQTATITPVAALASGAYTLTVLDTIRANAQNLDGELSSILPSGNGTPGGSAVLNFSIAFCPGDFNRDGFVDGFDYDDFVACFEGAGCPVGTTADFNQDGFADGFDYDDFVAAFEASC